MKSVLVLWYSQSGQLAQVMEQVVFPLRMASDIRLEERQLEPQTPYPFPWSFWQFLDAFPETVTLKPGPIKPLHLDLNQRYDLIIIGYPIWFLSPPPPLTAFLQSEEAKRLLPNTPVVTVTACRNMWLMAQETVKTLLNRNGANHVDHIALTDQGDAFSTFITTPRWMLTGKKNAFWKFPPAGVAPSDINASSRFGEAIKEALRKGQQQRSMLQGLGACDVDARLIASEKIGKRSFKIWGMLLSKLGKPGSFIRRIGLGIYVTFLLAMIITVVPITMLIKFLLRPLLKNKLAQLKTQFEQPSGSSRDRIRTAS